MALVSSVLSHLQFHNHISNFNSQDKRLEQHPSTSFRTCSFVWNYFRCAVIIGENAFFLRFFLKNTQRKLNVYVVRFYSLIRLLCNKTISFDRVFKEIFISIVRKISHTSNEISRPSKFYRWNVVLPIDYRKCVGKFNTIDFNE